MKEPRCFVAMAFGHEDTDAIYDKYIKPTVKKFGFTPRRIDRVLHNDYIDRKIIEEIKTANICVADLTYARPSVYFEAGYAQREIPILFTCRKDHFLNKEETLRVHFDLRQRNIIPWRNENDRTFLDQFRKRFNHISRPLLIAFDKNNKLEKEREAFRRFSSYERQKRVSKTLDRILKSCDYKIKGYKPTFFHRYAHIAPEYVPTYSFHYKKVGNNLIIIHDILYETITKRNVDDNIQIVHHESNYLEILPKPFLKNVKKIRYITFFISLSRFNKNNLQNYTIKHRNPMDNYYVSDIPLEIISLGQRYPKIEEFGIFDEVKSITEITQKFKTFMRSIRV
jgi:nucleoside 2-deoxyribosyltransferase